MRQLQLQPVEVEAEAVLLVFAFTAAAAVVAGRSITLLIIFAAAALAPLTAFPSSLLSQNAALLDGEKSSVVMVTLRGGGSFSLLSMEGWS